MVVVLGLDVHKRTHTVVAVNEAGAKLAEMTVEANTAGHRKAMRWAAKQFCGAELRWAVEDCRHMTARLERDLINAGQHVVRVAPKLMGQQRRSVRTPGKSDPIDALAVARVAAREPDLPIVSHDELSRTCKLLTDHRETLVWQRTSQINRLRWHLHELNPEWDQGAKDFGGAKTCSRTREQLLPLATTVLVAELALMLLDDIERINAEAKALDKRLEALVTPIATELLAINGCGVITAAKILGETAGSQRFRSEACFAMHAGVAPIPVWSGNTAGRVRLNRGGNRQLNAAVHRIAITQVRLGGPGKLYYEKKRTEGMTSTEAYRALKRQIVKIIFRALNNDQQAANSRLPAAA
jgi:transposase